MKRPGLTNVMSHWRKIGRVVAGFAVLIASQGAIAETTTLICHVDPPQSQGFTEDGPTIIELNEAQSSVVVHFSPIAITGVLSGGPIPSYSTGPLSATFAADTISFAVPQRQLSYTINRLTGILVNSANWKWTCQAGKRQF